LSLFNELKRRNVLRVGAAYVVGAWLLIQVAETIFPLFGFDDTPARIVVIALAIAFVPMLILAWAFELTPEGLKKESEVDRSQSILTHTGKKLDRMIMVVLALALGYFAFDKFVFDPQREAAMQQQTAEQLASATENAHKDGRAEALVEYYGEKSIAVLPFVNMSDEPGNEYFTDGMHDELLTRLAYITALKVISRTSVMRYRDTDKSLPEIARELSVATILEGGVQRVGKQVRINVQLINAHTDEHLWAKIFDRELTTENLFGIQSEISKAIADALQAQLSPAALASVEEVLTDNTEAYDLYLQAIKERRIWRGSDTYKAMKPLLERAVALDPNFLRAQIMLAKTYGRLLWTGADPDRIYGPKALELVTDIRRRWPERIEGRLALGDYYYTVERDYTHALAAYQAVEEVFPNDLEMLRQLRASLKRLGRYAEFLRYARRVVELDPANGTAAGELYNALVLNGQIEEGLAFIAEAVNRFPENSSLASRLASERLKFLGDVEGFLAYGERLREQGRWGEGGGTLTWLLYGRGDLNAALEHADARQSDEYDWGAADADLDRALILRMEGRADEAQVAADRALGFWRSWIEAGRPFPTTLTKVWYTTAAFCAAVAGDLEAVAEYRASALNVPEKEFLNRNQMLFLDSQITALLGDPKAGWAMVVPILGSWQGPTARLLAVHPFYRDLYGDAPGYQEYIMQAEIAE
jgi:TolB-like protein